MWSTHRDRYLAALLDADAPAAQVEAHLVRSTGASREELYDRVVAPAMTTIGDLWAAGELSVADEHLASCITAAVLERTAHADDADPSAPLAVVGAAPGDAHAIGPRMAADCLAAAGWRVHYLGASLPADDLLAFARRHGARLLGLSVSMPEHVPALRALTAQLGAGDRPFVVAGGAGVSRCGLGAAQLGVDAVCEDLEALRGISSLLLPAAAS
jgi:MerR family transcriptional regulator, light-induced transcriptional regulator